MSAVQTKKEDQEWMLKEDAAKLLGTNPRSIERLSRQGKVQRSYLPRLPREKQSRVVFLRSDLEGILKGVPAQPGAPTPPAVVSNNTAALTLVRSAEGQAESWSALSTTLAKMTEKLSGPSDSDRSLAEHLAKLSAAYPSPKRDWPAWLTFEEACEYSGLTAPFLEGFLRDGLIHCIGRGRKSWRIQRASLDAFGSAAHQ